MKVKHQDIREVQVVEGKSYFTVIDRHGRRLKTSSLPRQTQEKMALLDAAQDEHGWAALKSPTSVLRRNSLNSDPFSVWMGPHTKPWVLYSFFTSKHIDWEFHKV